MIGSMERIGDLPTLASIPQLLHNEPATIAHNSSPNAYSGIYPHDLPLVLLGKLAIEYWAIIKGNDIR